RILQVVPTEWHRHGRARPGPWREGTDRRVGAIVSQIIDEDLSFASRLCESCRVGARIGLRDGFAYGAREVEAFGDGSLAFERDDDVQSTPASGLDPGSQLQRLKDVAHERGGLHDLPPRHLRPRIEIPYKPVRAVDIVSSGIPRVDL